MADRTVTDLTLIGTWADTYNLLVADIGEAMEKVEIVRKLNGPRAVLLGSMGYETFAQGIEV